MRRGRRRGARRRGASGGRAWRVRCVRIARGVTLSSPSYAESGGGCENRGSTSRGRACVVWWRRGRGKRRVAVGATRATREKAGVRPRVDVRRLGKGFRGLTVSSLTVALSSSTLAMVPAAPSAPSALPGVVLALAKHLHGQARPVNQESRAAAGDLGLGLVLALPRLGLLRRNREERRQISRTSRGRSTRAWRRVRRRTVPMEKERYSGESTAPRGRVREGEGRKGIAHLETRAFGGVALEDGGSCVGKRGSGASVGALARSRGRALPRWGAPRTQPRE